MPIIILIFLFSVSIILFGDIMLDLKECRLCPRNCGVNRYIEKGVCGATDKLRVAYYSLHKWEEPIISGINGSGTVFFSHCNLKCIFCQNKKISTDGYGREISEGRLKQIFMELQDEGAHNINLVTPTIFVPQIVSVLQRIKNKELKIPVVYNTSSYECKKTIETLKGLVDIYLADLKYYDDDLAIKYSKCKDYFKFATEAIDEMFSQVGKFNIQNGLIKKGLVVRVLILPGHIDDSKKIISYLYNKYGDNIIISIMNQYTPIEKFSKYKNLNRKVTDKEYDEVVDYAVDLGVTNAFIQDGETQMESFIPQFNCDIV